MKGKFLMCSIHENLYLFMEIRRRDVWKTIYNDIEVNQKGLLFILIKGLVMV